MEINWQKHFLIAKTAAKTVKTMPTMFLAWWWSWSRSQYIVDSQKIYRNMGHKRLQITMIHVWTVICALCAQQNYNLAPLALRLSALCESHYTVSNTDRQTALSTKIKKQVNIYYSQCHHSQLPLQLFENHFVQFPRLVVALFFFLSTFLAFPVLAFFSLSEEHMVHSLHPLITLLNSPTI